MHNVLSRRFYKVLTCFSLIFLFSFKSIFASSLPSVGSVVTQQKSLNLYQEVNNYFEVNYGNASTAPADSDTALLVSIMQSLAKLSSRGVAYGIDRTNKYYYLTGTLTYLSDWLMQITENQYDTYKTIQDFYDRYYTYSDGNAALLNNINTQAVNIYGSTSASNVHLAALRNELKNIDWIDTDISYIGAYETPTSTTPLTVGSSYSGNKVYLRFSQINNNTIRANNVVYRIVLPVGALNNLYRSDFISGINYYVGENPMPGVSEYTELIQDSTGVVIIGSVLNAGTQYNQIELTLKHPIYLDNISNFKFQYLAKDTFDAILYQMLYKDNQSEIVEAINNKTIEAELDNSIGTDDIQINESLPSGGLVDSARIITRLKSQFGTDVSVLDFISNYNISDLSGWFSSDNANVVQSINSSYTDLYE